jgi:hypothetical protein
MEMEKIDTLKSYIYREPINPDPDASRVDGSYCSFLTFMEDFPLPFLTGNAVVHHNISNI